MRNDKKNIIVDLTFQFSVKSILYCELLGINKKYAIAKQLIRASTAICANVREAQNAESKNDFIHKMKIASKEADETRYWVDIIQEIPTHPQNTEQSVLLKPIELILTKIN